MLEEDNVFKISMPLISDLELKEIDNNMDTIINQFLKQFVRDKDLAIAQHIVQKQQEEIELLKEQKQYVIDEYGETIEKKDKRLKRQFKLLLKEDKNKQKLIKKLEEEMQKNEWSLHGYDCTISDYKQSQAIGAWFALQKIRDEILKGEKE